MVAMHESLLVLLEEEFENFKIPLRYESRKEHSDRLEFQESFELSVSQKSV